MDIPVYHNFTLARAWGAVKAEVSQAWRPEPNIEGHPVREPKWLEQRMLPLLKVLHAKHEDVIANSTAPKEIHGSHDSRIEASFSGVNLPLYCQSYDPVEVESILDTEAGETSPEDSLAGDTCFSNSERSISPDSIGEEPVQSDTEAKTAQQQAELLEDSAVSDDNSNDTVLPACCNTINEKWEYAMISQENCHQIELDALKIDRDGEMDDLTRDHKEALDQLQAKHDQEIQALRANLKKRHQQTIKDVQNEMGKEVNDLKTELRAALGALNESKQTAMKLQIQHDDSCRLGVSCAQQNDFLRTQVAQLEQTSRQRESTLRDDQGALRFNLRVAMNEVATSRGLYERAQETIAKGERYISRREAHWKIATEGLRQATLLMQANNPQATSIRLLQQNAEEITRLVDENCSRVGTIYSLYRERQWFLEEWRQKVAGDEKTFGEAIELVKQLEADIVKFQKQEMVLRGVNSNLLADKASLQNKAMDLEAAVSTLMTLRHGLQVERDQLRLSFSVANAKEGLLRNEITALRNTLNDVNESNQISFAASMEHQKRSMTISNLTEQLVENFYKVQQILQDKFKNSELQIQSLRNQLDRETSLSQRGEVSRTQLAIAPTLDQGDFQEREASLKVQFRSYKQLIPKSAGEADTGVDLNIEISNESRNLSDSSAVLSSNIEIMESEELSNKLQMRPKSNMEDRVTSLVIDKSPTLVARERSASISSSETMDCDTDISSQTCFDSKSSDAPGKEPMGVHEEPQSVVANIGATTIGQAHNNDAARNPGIKNTIDVVSEETPKVKDSSDLIDEVTNVQPPKLRKTKAERREAAIKAQAGMAASAAASANAKKQGMNRKERRTKVKALIEESKKV